MRLALFSAVPRFRLLHAPALALTLLCCATDETAEPCWDDSRCGSGSCSGGCENGWLELIESLFDDDDGAPRCEGLDELACVTTEGCVANRSGEAYPVCSDPERLGCSAGYGSFASCERR